MKTKQPQNESQSKANTLSLRENGAFSWRFAAVLSLMGCIAIEVLFNLLPIDHNTLLLYWFFPASLLLFSQLYTSRRVTKNFEIKLLAAFLAWGVVTVFSNHSRAHMVDSYLWFASACAAIFLCFGIAYAFEQEQAKRVLMWIIVSMLIVAVLLSLLSLIAVFAKEIAEKFPSVFEGVSIAGGRLSIDTHPNRSAPAPALGIILAGILLANTKKGWKKALLILAALICYIPLAQTVSRTAILGAGIAIAFEIFLALRDVLNGRMHTILRWGICALAAAAVVIVFYKGADVTVQACNTILAQGAAAQTEALPEASSTAEQTPALPAATSTTQEPSTLQTNETADAVVSRDLSDADSFNGRTDIWLGVWNGLQKNPDIFAIGTGPWIASEVMAPYFPAESPIGIFHNSLVGTLVSFGVPGLLLSLAVLAVAADGSLRLSFGKKQVQPLAVRMLPAVLLFAVAEGMMEDFLFATNSLNIVWIWFMIAAGFILRLNRTEQAA